MARWRNILIVVLMILKWLGTLTLARCFFHNDQIPHDVVLSTVACIIPPCCDYFYRAVNQARQQISSSDQNAVRAFASQLPELQYNIWSTITVAISTAAILSTIFPGVMTTIASWHLEFLALGAWQYL